MDEKLHKCNTVTFGIIAYNEERYLPKLLTNLLDQSYPKSSIEVILVDGNSNDTTRNIMTKFQTKYMEEYIAIKILDNYKRIQPAGWNMVITNASCDVILRIDAHAEIPADFIEKSMSCINEGENVCGGLRINKMDRSTPWKNMLLDVEQTLLGSGFAQYRRKSKERTYTKSVFHGAYRREVFERVGLFNEGLSRTEDNEMHYRIRKAGYRICYDSNIISFYQTRNTLKKMLNQKLKNGFWIGKTLYVCPDCLSLFYFAPLALVLASAGAVILTLYGHKKILLLEGALYAIVLLPSAIYRMIKNHNIADIVLPIVCGMVHFTYGIGIILGVFSGKPTNSHTYVSKDDR